MTGGMGQRSLLAPAGESSVDELRIAGQRHLGADPEPFAHPGAEGLDEGIGALDQSQQRLDSCG